MQLPNLAGEDGIQLGKTKQKNVGNIDGVCNACQKHWRNEKAADGVAAIVSWALLV
jgi:hypothetical protein